MINRTYREGRVYFNIDRRFSEIADRDRRSVNLVSFDRPEGNVTPDTVTVKEILERVRPDSCDSRLDRPSAR